MHWTTRNLLFVGVAYLLVLVAAFPEVILGGYSLHPGLLHPFGISNDVQGTLGTRRVTSTFAVELSTSAYYEAPINEFVGQSLRRGILPLWNPSQSGGGPLLAQYSSRLLFPYQIVENLAGSLWYDAFWLGRLWLAGIGTFFLCMSLGAGILPSFAAGIVYLLSGVFIWFVGLEQFANPALVLPYLLWACEALARRPTPLAFAGTVAAAALLLLAGQPEVALYGFFLAGLFFLLRIWNHRQKYGCLWGTFALGCALGLSAPQILPFLMHLPHAKNHLHSFSGGAGVASPTPPTLLKMIAFPTLSTYPSELRIYPVNGHWDYVGGYLGAPAIALLVLAAFFLWRNKLFLFLVGFGLLVLAKNVGVPPFGYLGELPLFNQVWSPRWAGCAWVLAFAVALALGMNELKYDGKKGIRIGALAALLLVGAAGFISANIIPRGTFIHGLHYAGIDQFPEYHFPSVYFGIISLVGGALAAAIAVAFGKSRDAILKSLVLILAVSLIGCIPRGLPPSAMTLIGLATVVAYLGALAIAFEEKSIGIILICFQVAAIFFVSISSPAGLPSRAAAYAEQPYMAFLRGQLKEHDRVTAGEGIWHGNTAGALGFSDIQGVWSLPLAEYDRFHWRFLRESPVPEAQQTYWYQGMSSLDGSLFRVRPDNVEKRLNLYSLFSIRYFLLPRNQDPGAYFPGTAKLAFQDDRVSVYENSRSVPRAFLARNIHREDDSGKIFGFLNEPSFNLRDVYVGSKEKIEAQSVTAGDVVQISALEPNQVVVNVKSAGPRLLVLTDLFAPGWTANTGEIVRVNGLFRGTIVPAGDHKVVFTYSPPGFYMGVALAGVSLLVLLLLMRRLQSAAT